MVTARRDKPAAHREQAIIADAVRRTRKGPPVNDTSMTERATEDLSALIGTAAAAIDMLDKGHATTGDLRSALHTMRQIINRAENRLDEQVAARVRLARTADSPHGNTRPPAGPR